MRAALLVCVLAAACSDPSHPSGPGDAGVDTAEPDAPAASLALTDDHHAPISDLTFSDSDDATLRVANHGSAASAPITVELTGAGHDDVVLDPGSTCPGLALAPGAECTIVLHYVPATDDARPVVLSVSGAIDQELEIRPVARPALRIVFAGGGLGEVQVSLDALDSRTLATCTATCRVRASLGTPLRLTAVTPQVTGGLSGSCDGPAGACTLTLTAGAVVTATFSPLPGELWTRLIGGTRIMSAAFDGSGNLVVANDKITKLSAAGGTLWQVPLAVCSVATGPGDTVFGQTATTLYKLAPDGTTLWTRPLDPLAIGCGITNGDDAGYDGFLHNLAVGSDGAVAVHGDHGVAYWDAGGALRWAINPGGGRFGVAIGPDGVIGAAVESENLETTDLARFAPDGSALAPIEHIAAQYHGMFVIDPTGRLLATSSGHSHTDALGHSVRLLDPDFAPNGICASGAGAAWLYEPDDDLNFARIWTLNRYAASGEQTSTFTSAPSTNEYGDKLGTNPHDLAGAPDGRVAVVGELVGATGYSEGGWITVLQR